MPIAIVTDGSCDLPKKLIEHFRIFVVPFQVIFDTEVYQLYGDTGTITKEEFYERLVKGPTFPTTAIPTPKAFLETFEKAAQYSNEIIAIFLSKELSGTIQSAKRIVHMVKDATITIIDSKVSASCLGLIVLEAAKLAKKGATKEEILQRLDEIIPQTRLIVVVDTLEYLYRGGRIGKAKKFFGSALNIKPILHFENGLVTPGGTIRGHEEVVKRLKFAAPLILDHAKTDYVFIWHTREEQIAKDLLDIMEAHNNDGKKILIQEAGPIIGTHVGPGSLGFTYIGEYNKNWLLKMKKN